MQKVVECLKETLSESVPLWAALDGQDQILALPSKVYGVPGLIALCISHMISQFAIGHVSSEDKL